jgi:hypothetical protein
MAMAVLMLSEGCVGAGCSSSFGLDILISASSCTRCDFLIQFLVLC